MELKLQIILILSCIIMLLIFFDMLKKNKLYVKYSIIWLGSIIFILFFSLFPKIIFYISKFIGIVTPANLLFLIGILSLGAIVFSLTVSQSRNSAKVIKLSQEFAILENEMKKFKDTSQDKNLKRK